MLEIDLRNICPALRAQVLAKKPLLDTEELDDGTHYEGLMDLPNCVSSAFACPYSDGGGLGAVVLQHVPISELERSIGDNERVVISCHASGCRLLPGAFVGLLSFNQDERLIPEESLVIERNNGRETALSENPNMGLVANSSFSQN